MRIHLIGVHRPEEQRGIRGMKLVDVEDLLRRPQHSAGSEAGAQLRAAHGARGKFYLGYIYLCTYGRTTVWYSHGNRTRRPVKAR
jgi:hypothetical protein